MNIKILTFVLLTPLFLAACAGNTLFGDKEIQKQYSALEDKFCQSDSVSYNEVECNKIQLFSTLSLYREAQAAKNSLVLNPDVPQELKDALETLDDEATVALRAYTDSVLTFGGATEAQILAAIQVLNRLQQKILEAQTEAQ